MKHYLCFMLLALCACNNFAQKPETPGQKEDFSDDWAALSKYRKENAALPPPKAGEGRVVFLGSSIFEFWKEKNPKYFSSHPYIDRGVSGQISPQLLVRFRQDVIDLKPAAVIILAGSNDISNDKGHVTNESIMDHIKTMSELAKLHNIKVILCKYLPIYEYPWNRSIKPSERIVDLNNKIVAYSEENKFTVLDYWTPLVDQRKGQKAELTVDGVHPNLAGYKIMEQVTEKAIDQALGRKK